MQRNIQLLVIDPQNDFCDIPEALRPVNPATGQRLAPALPVAGAHADMQRVAGLIREGGTGLAGITITLDSHHRFDIAHPTFWRQGSGADVTPFTPITAAQVRAGTYVPRDPTMLPRALAYLDELEARGRYTLMVWPVHCEIGTWGHNVHDDLRAAYNSWEDRTLSVVNKVSKGSNPWTEHYSAVQAEVPLDDDPATQTHEGLIAMARAAHLLLIAGEASSHCVRATTEHIVAALGRAAAGKVVLLTDGMSPVGGFEAQQAEFFAAMAAQGVQHATCEQILPRLRDNPRA